MILTRYFGAFCITLRMENCGDLIMFRFLMHKKRKKVLTEPIISNYKDTNNIVYESATQPINNLDNKMNRLIELIGIAIEEWSKEYNLEKLPKKVLFEQVLDAMRIMEFIMNNRSY